MNEAMIWALFVGQALNIVLLVMAVALRP